MTRNNKIPVGTILSFCTYCIHVVRITRVLLIRSMEIFRDSTYVPGYLKLQFSAMSVFVNQWHSQTRAY